MSYRSGNRRLFVCFVVFFCLCTVASGTDYYISNTGDGFSINGTCNFREAMWASDENSTYDTCPAGSSAARRRRRR